MATQVVHIVYVSCALMSSNLQVPDLVLSYVHKTLVVNFMLFCLLMNDQALWTLLHTCDYTPFFQKPK